jgi:hypothetical protein
MSKKTYNKCEDCRKYYECDSAWNGDVACDSFKSNERTIFDRITASEEVLAEKLVYRKYYILRGETWTSNVLTAEFETKTEAIAATVAKLKEVENDTGRN